MSIARTFIPFPMTARSLRGPSCLLRTFDESS